MEQQEAVYRLQMMEQQLQQLQQQLQAIENGISELKGLKSGLDEIPNSNGKEIFAKIGRGIYVKSKIVSDELLINVGGDNFVGKDVNGAKELIEVQIEKLKEVKGELERGIEETTNEFMKMIQQYQESEGE